MFEWAYDGINSSIPRNVGPECANYLSLKRRIIETLFISVFIISCIVWGLKHVTLPKKVAYVNQDCVGRRVLLIIMSLVLGMEIGFKFTSRTVIYLLNPCHITTALQVSLIYCFNLSIKIIWYSLLDVEFNFFANTSLFLRYSCICWLRILAQQSQLSSGYI